MLYQASHFGFRIEEVPAKCRYFDEMSSVGFKTGVVYGLKTLVGRGAADPAPGRDLASRKYKP